ncbi:hypothetical protein UA08_06613 [Talaromyces atroroseus]|uniref:FAD-binding domain-containing protein n=1 Tax=Talaromyces atroroseus TaxID=1441469 RepID=A0A225AAW7_TALAT|nr:hypothetical protein UA08_06613 [Talaromyces atroroseus]OKL58042.1 hypothetical protein UA08_06613 [Talaromyces atroroseus]
MSTTEAIRVPVLIVGGGIVGLSASLFLSHHGIHSLLVERHSGTSIHPRARSVNARTMEIFRNMGLSDMVREAGSSLVPSFGIHSGTSLKSIMDAKPRREDKTADKPKMKFVSSSKTGPEDGIFVTQDMLEPVILKAARESGGDVRFYIECIGVEQDQEKVTATIRDRETGDKLTVIADYLIAGDGAKSPIRSQLGVSTTGCGAIGHMLSILFHADLKSLVKRREFSICVVNNPEVVGSLTAINNSDRWVFHLSYDPAKGEKPEDFPPEKCKDLLRIALGIPDIDIEIVSILPWEPTVQVVTKLQHSRIFHAGDAAHTMPPYGGQGANTAISDAYNLAWKISAVLKHQAGPGLLQTYDIERLPVGKAAAEASATVADERGIIYAKISWGALMGYASILPITSGFGYVYSSQSPAVVGESRWPLGGVTWKAWSVPSLLFSMDGRPGSRAPHVWVEKDGNRISTLDLFGKEFVLVAGSAGDSWVEACQEVKKKFSCLEFTTYGVGPKAEIVDTQRRWETAAGISSTGALLVRPDGYVAWRQRRAPAHLQDMLEGVMREILCL